MAAAASDAADEEAVEETTDVAVLLIHRGTHLIIMQLSAGGW